MPIKNLFKILFPSLNKNHNDDFRFSKTELLGCEKMTATLTDENKALEGELLFS